MTGLKKLIKPIYITAALLLVLTVGLIVSYYRSPLHSAVEDHLYDYRVRLAPQLYEPKHVVVLKLGPQVGEAEGIDDRLPVEPTLKAIDAALLAGARNVVVLLTPPYDRPEIEMFAKRALNDPRIFLGLRDIGDSKMFATALPEALRPVANQIVAADLQNYFNNRVVRSLPIIDSRNGNDSHFLLPKIAGVTSRESLLRRFGKDLVAHDIGDEHSLHLRLNYIRPEAIYTLEANDTSGVNLNLQDKIVVISNTTYRPTSVSKPLPVYANTPWQGDGNDLKNGVPNAVILAIGIENIMSENWLRVSPRSLQWLQTILVSSIALAVWIFPPSWAVFLFLGMWLLLLIGHGILFQTFNLYIPLTDTMLFSLLATIGGSLLRMSRETHLRAEMMAQADADRDLHRLQDQFLHRFAGELARLNNQLSTRLNKLENCFANGSMGQQAQIKASSSAEELNDFLQGIQQFAAMGDNPGDNITIQRRPLQLRALIERILDRFESRIHELQLRITVDVEPELLVHTDDVLLDQILFNLISNATKYSPKGGLIRIAAAPKNGKIEIQIMDNGPGIPVEEMDKIFEKFYRIQNDQLYRAKGHGLGLYLSKYFATLLHAEIAVESFVGNGSTFILVLPETRR